VFCPSGAHKIFIAKMKRESDHTSRDAGQSALGFDLQQTTMKSRHLSRLRGLFPAALAFAAPLTPICRAQGPAPDVTLGTYVVSASRTPQDPLLAPSSVTLLPLEDLQEAQVGDLRTALSETPGVVVANSGAEGGQSSVFLRGANSDQTLFVVDGVRLNTTTASYYNFLGAADLAGLDRLEVLRGPQSTLYGSSAMGGVVLMETARGAGAPSGTLSGYAGSFGSLGAEAAAQGSDGSFDYSASLTRQETDNDRAYNALGAWNYSARVDDQAGPSLLVGSTFRGQLTHYEEPGPTTYPSPGDVQTVADLATVYADWRADPGFDSRLTAAWHQDEYTWDKDTPDEYYARNSRDILDWQNTWQAASWAEIVGGFNGEQSYYQAGGLTTDRRRGTYGRAPPR
jgi:vitamin B12 transporter